MIVLDTHVWIWLVSEPEKLSRPAADAIAAADRLGVSTISCWEIATKYRLGKLTLDRDCDLWVSQALSYGRLEPIDVTAEIAAAAGRLEIHGDPADRIIAASAAAIGAVLVTKDAILRRESAIATLW